MIDFTKLAKGARIVLKDGRTLIVSGLYLSGDGPVIMAKMSPTQTTAENVPISSVESVT